MTTKLPWFERKFDFNISVNKYPDILERLRGTPVRIEEEAKSISPAILIHRVGDTWSIQENVGHLLDLEPLWAGRVDDILADVETMREADLTNRKTYEANHNSAKIDELAGAFREARQRLVARLDGLDVGDFARSANHPRLQQPMRLVDLCLFVADHDDYHLARMTQLVDLVASQT